MTDYADREIDRLESLVEELSAKLAAYKEEIARLREENEELEHRLWDVSY